MKKTYSTPDFKVYDVSRTNVISTSDYSVGYGGSNADDEIFVAE